MIILKNFNILTKQEMNTTPEANHKGINICSDRYEEMAFISDPPHLIKKFRFVLIDLQSSLMDAPLIVSYRSSSFMNYSTIIFYGSPLTS